MTTTGIAGAQRVDHVALTVTDLDAAVTFVVEVLGGEVVYRLPPLAHDDDWMLEHLDVPPRSAAEIALIRLGPTTNLELFQYSGPGRNTTAPGWHDPGHQHLGLLVPAVAEAADAVLRLGGLLPQGPIRVAEAPSPLAGASFARFRTPWALSFELRSMPEHGSPAGRYRAPARWTNGAAGRSAAPPIPGLRGLDHIGYSVADLDAALAVFVDVLGGELLVRGTDKAGEVPVEIAVLRLGPTENVELSAYAQPGLVAAPPRNCDIGGRHLALHVRDVDAAAADLAVRPGFTQLGQPETIADGPIAGDRWVYVRSPIGLHLELVRMPDGDLPYEASTSARRRAAGTARWSDR